MVVLEQADRLACSTLKSCGVELASCIILAGIDFGGGAQIEANCRNECVTKITRAVKAPFQKYTAGEKFEAPGRCETHFPVHVPPPQK